MDAGARFSADELLLDRQIFDADGQPVGKVDDLELTTPDDGGPPVLIAVLCGPIALGPRIGGRLGRLWAAVGRRLRPDNDPQPVRIPLHHVGHVDRSELTLTVSRDQIDTDRLRNWARDNLIDPIPGSGAGA
jgi:hypothetical protein